MDQTNFVRNKPLYHMVVPTTSIYNIISQPIFDYYKTKYLFVYVEIQQYYRYF